MNHVLIVYLHGIGDNIMLTGVLRQFKRQHPLSEIDLVVLNAACAQVWQGNPLIRSLELSPIPQPHFWNPLEFRLKSFWRVRRYMAQLKQQRGYERVIFPTIQTLPEIIYHLTRTYGDHKVERLAVELGLPPAAYPYDLYSRPEEVKAADSVLCRLGSRDIGVVHPFSSDRKKRMSLDQVGEIIGLLKEKQLTPLLVGAEAERPGSGTKLPSESAFGLSFGVLIELLKKTAIFVGTDSVVAHLAGFANTPHVVVVSSKLKPERYRPLTESSCVKLIKMRPGETGPMMDKLKAALEAIRNGLPQTTRPFS